MNDVLCPAETCPLIFGDYLVYRDSTHLTATFSRLLAGVLEERMRVVHRFE